MKSSVIPFAAGAMTIAGVWLFTSNKQKIDKLAKNVTDSMDQLLQKCKQTMQEDSCSCKG